MEPSPLKIPGFFLPTFLYLSSTAEFTDDCRLLPLPKPEPLDSDSSSATKYPKYSSCEKKSSEGNQHTENAQHSEDTSAEEKK